MMWRVMLHLMVVAMLVGSFASFELCADTIRGKCRWRVWVPFLVGGLVMGAVAVGLMVLVVRIAVGA